MGRKKAIKTLSKRSSNTENVEKKPRKGSDEKLEKKPRKPRKKRAEVEKSEDIALQPVGKVIRVNCLKCHSVRPVIMPDIKVGYGGIKCHSCNAFDKFYGEYEDEGACYSWVTLPYFVHAGTKEQNGKYQSHVSYILSCEKAYDICEFFQKNECSTAEMRNIFVDLGIGVEFLTKSYSSILEEKEVEQQIEKERKLSKQLKKVINAK